MNNVVSATVVRNNCPLKTWKTNNKRKKVILQFHMQQKKKNKSSNFYLEILNWYLRLLYQRMWACEQPTIYKRQRVFTNTSFIHVFPCINRGDCLQRGANAAVCSDSVWELVWMLMQWNRNMTDLLQFLEWCRHKTSPKTHEKVQRLSFKNILY